MKIRILIPALFILFLVGALYVINHQKPVPLMPAEPQTTPASSTETISGLPTLEEKPESSALDQLLGEKASSSRKLDIPLPIPTRPPAAIPAPPTPLTPQQMERAEGRKKRASLPMGVVIWDGASVYDKESGGKRLYGMQTGDFVRVLGQGNERVQVQPGLDLYLAATTKDIQAAGERFPDQPGWVDRGQINIFTPEQAEEFILKLDPMTLGEDPSFSTLDFYDRAMKNPDPVVHRIIAPRLIAIAGLHEDYMSSWSQLYRDRDPKIRDAALASLKERGVGQSRLIIEDLILRVSELTQTRARGETEQEVLQILRVLKASGHPRVPAALTSFQATWKDAQSPRLNEALADILKAP